MTESMPIEADEKPRVDMRTREGREMRAAADAGRAPLRQRETLRPDTRSSSEIEAEEYAQKIIEELGSSDTFVFDEFFIDKDEIPEGWEYQWKRLEVLGKEDRGHSLEMARNKWRPVPAERHPHKMPSGHQGPIIIKGLMLCEIPKVIADQRRKAEQRESRDVLRNSEAQLYETPANTAPRDDPSVINRGLNKVSREHINPKASRFDD